MKTRIEVAGCLVDLRLLGVWLSERTTGAGDVVNLSVPCDRGW
jgi:hypothetical protein